MITIFTTAKSFKGNARISQLNALRSWKALHPSIEVILFGEGEGYAEVSESLGLVHIPDVKTSTKGTPLINSMFERAAELGRYDIQAYVNCDIILFEDFLEASVRIKEGRFMIVGQRYDLDIGYEIDFSDKLWGKNIRDMMSSETLHPPSGSDYFLFRRGIWKELPALVVGRAGYDNWLIYYCRANRIMVIDASEAVKIAHQNHDYKHLSGGQEEAWSGAEASSNLALSGGYDYVFTLIDTDWRMLVDGTVVRNRCRGNLYRFAEVYMILRKEKIWGKAGLFGLRSAHFLYKRIPVLNRLVN